jgi:daunorubicin resistance ABC transporter ATP-binding subunit
MATILDARDDVPPDQHVGRSAIVVDEVTKRYGQHTALERVSLDVKRGSVLALLGPNGAGKTTLVRVLTTLLQPDRGRASVAGYDVVAEAAAVRRSIGLVGQHAAVDEYLTGRENLMLVARLLRMNRTESEAAAEAALESFGLTEIGDVPVASYSGGLRRRLDVAVTLLSEPAVLFLDEPTSGLDPASRREVWALVEGLAADGTTILLTTQYLEEADRLADRVAVIDHGRMVATGTPGELKARLGCDAVHLRLADPADLADALATLGAMSLVTVVDQDQDGVMVRGPDGAALLPEVLRSLDANGVAATAAEVRRPGLDEVFLALTSGQAAVPADGEPTDQVPAGNRSRHRRGGHLHRRRNHS